MSDVIRVNPIACEAHGLCAELLPERITLDEWGYPIIDGTPVDGEQLAHARRAARACPTLALLLQRAPTAPARPRGARAAPASSAQAAGGTRRRAPRAPAEQRRN